MYQNVQGCLEPDLEIELTVNGSAIDLSDALDQVMLWTKPDGTVIEVDLLPGTGGLAAGVVKRVWVDGDTDDIGDHEAQVVVTRGNGEDQVFPSDGSRIHWRIFARLVVS